MLGIFAGGFHGPYLSWSLLEKVALPVMTGGLPCFVFLFGQNSMIPRSSSSFSVLFTVSTHIKTENSEKKSGSQHSKHTRA